MNFKLKPLGYDATIEQEDVGAIQLERNGRELSSKRMKHINVRYFYIVDRLKVGISAELSTSQLEICKVIILLWHFKEIYYTLIVKLLWGWMGSTFRTPLYKIGELVMAYNVKASNKTSQPRIFYVLYVGPNIQLLTTPKWKPVPMLENIIQAVNN